MQQRDVDKYCGIMHFNAMRSVPTVTRTGEFYVEQYNTTNTFATMEDELTFIEMVPQWEAIRFGVGLTTSDPVNYLSVVSNDMVFRLDAEIR